MNFLDIAKTRFYVRNYAAQKVEQDKLNQILQAARVAPTAANLQPVRLIVVQQEEGLQKIGKSANIYKAPLAIIVCVDTEKTWKRPFDGKLETDTDASILTDHMMLQATELGLGSVWVDYFKPDVLKEEFALPDKIEPVHILVLGYANETPANPERHTQTRIPMEDLVYYEHL